MSYPALYTRSSNIVNDCKSTNRLTICALVSVINEFDYSGASVFEKKYERIDLLNSNKTVIIPQMGNSNVKIFK